MSWPPPLCPTSTTFVMPGYSRRNFTAGADVDADVTASLRVLERGALHMDDVAVVRRQSSMDLAPVLPHLVVADSGRRPRGHGLAFEAGSK
jgi:hypothetical protein